MSYTPTNWQCGDTISAEKLNKIEQGIAECCSGGGTLTVTETIDGNDHILSHTWQEISDAFPNVQFVSSDATSQTAITSVTYLPDVPIYDVKIGSTRYDTSSSDGYPTYTATPQ